MPPGKKAPPQQSSLTELWGSKRKKQSAPAGPTDTHQRTELGDDATANAGSKKSSERACAPLSPSVSVLLIVNAAVSPKREPTKVSASPSDSTHLRVPREFAR
jgi:hypothetical protein